jgi:hypothetical protein
MKQTLVKVLSTKVDALGNNVSPQIKLVFPKGSHPLLISEGTYFKGTRTRDYKSVLVLRLNSSWLEDGIQSFFRFFFNFILN